MANRLRSSQKTRRRRKLPNIQQLDNTSGTSATIFWYSYQTALSWIRSHEDVISKCVQLLQLYPNLIQDASMDQFWDFIESLLQDEHPGESETRHTEGVRHKRDAGYFSKHQEKDIVVKGPEIPQISVTETSSSTGPAFTISALHARTPRVHLISRSSGCHGSGDDRFLYSGVIDMLQEDFYIRVTNAKQPSGHEICKESQRWYVVAESDVCVYLFNDSTLEDAACFNDLCIALAQKIPVVYVRYHKKELPKTFSETVNKNSKGCITLKDYIEKCVPETHSASTSTMSAKNTRVKKKLAPLIVGNRSKSASELNVRNIDVLYEKGGRSSGSLEIDLVFTLVSNFKNACIFDEADLDDCSSRLRHAIYQVLGICESKSELPSIYNKNASTSAQNYNHSPNKTSTSNNIFKTSTSPTYFAASCTSRQRFLSVPDPEDMISAREWGNSGSVSAIPQGKQNRDSDSDEIEDRVLNFDSDTPMAISPTLEQRATTYLIFDQNTAPDGPKKVEFPTEVDSALVESELEFDDCPAIPDSPINFYEIDLSREINSRGTPESDVSSVA